MEFLPWCGSAIPGSLISIHARAIEPRISREVLEARYGDGLCYFHSHSFGYSSRPSMKAGKCGLLCFQEQKRELMSFQPVSAVGKEAEPPDASDFFVS